MSENVRGLRVHPLFMGLVIALIMGLASTIFLRQAGVTVSINGAKPAAGEVQHATSTKQLYYSTMHPWIVQDHPGSCPICGMELVKMPADMQAEWQRNHNAA